jgi:uncharacterized membrane protein YdjX (TVP38/TMEM64 family)
VRRFFLVLKRALGGACLWPILESANNSTRGAGERWRAHRWAALALLILLLAGAAAALMPWQEGLDFARRAIEWMETRSREYPLLLVAALALLPLAFFPATVLIFLCGAHGPLTGFFLAMAGMALHGMIAYALGATLLRRPARRLCEWRGYKVPRVHSHNAARLTLLVRLLPGPSPTLQACLLALAHVPFATYMFVSLAVQSVLVLGCILIGASLFEGESGLAVAGVSLVIVLFLAARMVHFRNGQP